MNEYTISLNSGRGRELATLEADSVEIATTAYCASLGKKYWWHRQTGTPGKSGCFQILKPGPPKSASLAVEYVIHVA